MTDNGVAGPLAGLRIVELSSYVATPLSGLVLSQLGAEVIRVEQVGGAPDRDRMPRSPEGASLYWAGLNKGKKGIAVDLTSQAGRDLVADLIVGGGPQQTPGGGIVVSNSDRYADLGFEALSRRRPDLIHLLLTGQRDGGSALDYTVQAMVGFPFVQGPADNDRPSNSVVPAWDVAAGLYLATGLLAAERERRLTGKGQAVRIALADVALATAGTLGYIAEAQLTGVSRGPSGNEVYGTFGRDFATSDGVRFMIVAITASHFRKLTAAIGLADAMSAVEKALEADFGDEADRYRCRRAIASLFEETFARRPWSEVESLLVGTRIPYAPYRTFDDLTVDDSAFLRQSPLFSEVTQTGIATPFLAPGLPLVMDGHQVPAGIAPAIGQHTDEVLGAALGLSAERLAELHAEGTLG